MNGFSAHADRDNLVEYVGEAKKGGRLKNVMLVHGEPGPQGVLTGLLRDNGMRVSAPAAGDRLEA
jgi:predicted metal-dependent RNase